MASTSSTTVRALIAGTDLDAIDAHLAGLVARPAWQLDAACRHEDPALFFPAAGQPTAPAKALCASCAVVEQCRALADATQARDGIWGGIPARQLRRPQRRRVA